MSIHHQQAPTFRPFVLADVGPDGAPQAILVAPTPETVINRDTARTLIAELLAVVSDGLPAQRSPGCVRDVA